MGRELAGLAPEPKRLVIFPNGSHSDLYINGNNAIDAVRAWIDSLGHSKAEGNKAVDNRLGK